MTKDQNERLVVGFERIAEALEGLNEEISRAGKRYWPTPGPQREVVITRVPTEEDKINERQGNNIPIEQWLKNLPEPEDDEFELALDHLFGLIKEGYTYGYGDGNILSWELK